MTVNSRLKKWLNRLSTGFLLLFCSFNALASQTNGSLPFNNAMDKFQDNFFAWIFAALLILWAATCLMLAVGEWKESISKVLNFVFWGSMALAPLTFVGAIFTRGALF